MSWAAWCTSHIKIIGEVEVAKSGKLKRIRFRSRTTDDSWSNPRFLRFWSFWAGKITSPHRLAIIPSMTRQALL